MKINQVSQVRPANPYQRHEAKQEEYRNRMQQGKDQVEISSEAMQLASTVPASRAEKLEQLKDEIANGTYHVDARLIAEKLARYL